MNLDNLVGQTLDEKYLIERELGRGGMGAVYLSTHVGTERPVALKVIVPQFMQRTEFVERFRREARAAGRLRHPNVVDVTDFGFADTPDGRVAYLVMEYLDGCTLGEILEEENHLPLQWTLDILEQVSSAIQEAHRQGIIHRDLKPDNIWLEPNQRGGYTVKVLDFGIAKLENAHVEHHEDANQKKKIAKEINAAHAPSAKSTMALDENQSPTVSDNRNPATVAVDKQTIAGAFGDSRKLAIAEEKGTLIQQPINGEAGTLIQQPIAPQKFEEKTADADESTESEANTAIFQPSAQQTAASKQTSEAGTKLISAQIETAGSALSDEKKTAALTRVGAVLGTPLYMSPEQCRGEKLTAQSDIYSLGVIAYQMLTGKTPFTGDYLEVMRAHKETLPPPLEAKKISKKVKLAVMSALEKDPENRPPTVEAFASKLRANSEGIGTLFQKSLVIYSRHLPKFLGLALIFYSPLLLLTSLQIVISFAGFSELVSASVKIVLGFATMFISFTCGSMIVGASTWLVAQILAYPLKPVTLRSALGAVKTKWKKLAGTALLLGILEIIGFVFFFIPGIILNLFFALAAAVVMMENLHGYAALKRSNKLVARSIKTTFALTVITFFIPMFISLSLAYFAKLSVDDISGKFSRVSQAVQQIKTDNGEEEKPAESNSQSEQTIKQASQTKQKEDGTIINIGPNGKTEIVDAADKKNPKFKYRVAFTEALQQMIFMPISILLVSFFTIVGSLLYFKSRQAGGETMQDLLAQFQDADQPQSSWQQRVRERLVQSGRITTSRTNISKRATTGGKSET